MSASLTQQQRERVIALFEEGLGDRAVATRLHVQRSKVRRLHEGWMIRGRGVLVRNPSNQSYSFEVKLALVKRCLAGETPLAVATDAGLSSAQILRSWIRTYRTQGEEGLRPKPRGRPVKKPAEEEGLSEVEGLRREVEYLRAQNDYLGKVRALREQERRSK
jgi:transposase-like protein